MKREDGYYWVKHLNGWVVAYYILSFDGYGRWFLMGDEWSLGDNDFEEIDEKKIERNDKMLKVDVKVSRDWDMAFTKYQEGEDIREFLKTKYPNGLFLTHE